jgi:hypothetical protein
MRACTPATVGRAVSYDCWTCPQCSFSLTIVHSREGTRVVYDLEGWSRSCCSADLDTPLACPSVGRQMWKWLSPPEEQPAAPEPGRARTSLTA